MEKLVVSTKDELKHIIKCTHHGDTLNNLDVSKITDMSYLFCDSNIGGCDISQWDVSHVTNMKGMFYRCSYFNSDISQWDVSKVEDMSAMFYDCTCFTSDLSQWDISNVKDMSNMFALSNYMGDISNWVPNGKCKTKNMLIGCSRANSYTKQLTKTLDILKDL